MVGWCCLASVGLTGSTDPATKSYRARRTGWASEVTASRSWSWSAAEATVADLLTALGQDLDDDHIRDTPGRAAAAYAEMLTPRPFNPTTFPNDEGYNELVLARDIPFHSLCHQRSGGSGRRRHR
jgi:GTP cyclohydrolase I